MTPRRPNPFFWLWYALGGRLPARNKTWVLYDTTCRTWQLRHLARAFVQMSLIAPPVLLIVPGPRWVPLVGILLGWLVALQFAVFNMHLSVEHRVRQAGYPSGTAQAVRDAARSNEHAAAEARYAARYRADET